MHHIKKIPSCHHVLLTWLITIAVPVTLSAQEPERLDTSLFQLFNRIYLNHRATGDTVTRQAKANQDFGQVIRTFLSIEHLSETLRVYNATHHSDVDLSHMTIYYSVYEVEDPRIFKSLVSAMEAGVSIVLVTDRDNALPFRPASTREQALWNPYQRQFYLERYDTNRDSKVDDTDKDAIDYRLRLMKTWIFRLQQEFRKHLRRTDRPRHQELYVVTSPYKYVPPEGLLYLPLHHSKQLVIAIRNEDETTPVKGLIGTGNHTFSGMNGDMWPEVMDRLAGSEFLTHKIGPDDFIPGSKGNVDMLMEVSNPRVLQFFLQADILDAIHNYEQGRMFRENPAHGPPPFKDFILNDGSRVRLGVTQGRPQRGQLGNVQGGYDPNQWIVEFLLDRNQTIDKIEEIVDTEFLYSHTDVHRRVQGAIKKHRPTVIGIYDHSFAFQPYSKVLGLAGITRLTESRERADPTPGDPSTTTARGVRIIDSPYGLLPADSSDIRVFSRPFDKLHLKLMMFKYQYKDPQLSTTQTRFRIFFGSLNRSANGPNNRELFFSVDTADPFLYNTFREYAATISKQEYAIPLKEAYARFLVRSLFRFPEVTYPQEPDSQPPWEKILTPQRVQKIVVAIEAKDPTTRAEQLNQALRELSEELKSHSAFAGSRSFESALKLITLFFNGADEHRTQPKDLWLALHFVATAHTNAISEDSVRQVADYFFGHRPEPRAELAEHLRALAIDHAAISNILLRGCFVPSVVVSEEEASRSQLYPAKKVAPHQKRVREVIDHAFLSPDMKKLYATLRKLTPTEKHNTLLKLVSEFQKFRPEHQTPAVLHQLFGLFNEPLTLSDSDRAHGRLDAIGKQHGIPKTRLTQLKKVFDSFRREAQKAGWSLPHFHCK